MTSKSESVTCALSSLTGKMHHELLNYTWGRRNVLWDGLVTCLPVTGTEHLCLIPLVVGLIKDNSLKKKKRTWPTGVRTSRYSWTSAWLRRWWLTLGRGREGTILHQFFTCFWIHWWSWRLHFTKIMFYNFMWQKYWLIVNSRETFNFPDSLLNVRLVTDAGGATAVC